MKYKEYLRRMVLCICVWALLSFIGSFIKQLDGDKYSDIYGAKYGGLRVVTNNCGRTYPIDYILYNNLFCEIGDL